MREPAPRSARQLTAVLDSTAPVHAGVAFSLALGVFFIFVWSPLPWGWLGIDHYDDRALRLAAGQPFDTTDVPWGYAYYLAAFYAVFGHQPWLPLVVQVVLNAGVPVLLYQLVRPLTNQRTAALSALLTGLFSFNTVYAATQSSDSICTVLVLASLLLFERGILHRRPLAFAASGLFIGLASQFRPNLILLPFVLAAALLLVLPRTSALRNGILYLLVCASALAPWVVRNYELTRLFLPTSTHGGIQLWYGSLQSGAYLETSAENPRRYFAPAPFEYTSIEELPIIVRATIAGQECHAAPTLFYWTNRDKQVVEVRPSRFHRQVAEYSIPGQIAPTIVNWYFESTWNDDGAPRRRWTPPGGPSNPFVYFVSDDHLTDLDTDNQQLNVFDIARFVNAGDSVALRAALDRLAPTVSTDVGSAMLIDIIRQPTSTTLTLADGSTMDVPRDFGGRITDLSVSGGLAARILYAHAPAHPQPPAIVPTADPCAGLFIEGINDVFYRQEPHLMRRYVALALDNIRRGPFAFIAASVYRMLRVFLIYGSADANNTQQFAAGAFVYFAGTVLSSLYFSLFVAGAWIARRVRSPVGWLLVPVMYVPLTICFMLTNMRYSITVQPYVLTFVAIALLAAGDPLSDLAIRLRGVSHKLSR